MNGVPVVINGSTLRRAMGSFEAAADLGDAFRTAEDTSAYTVLAELDHVRHQLESEGGPGDVMVAPRDQLASLYQSFLAECATEDRERLGALSAGGYEAKFDEKDLIGWIGRSGIGWIRHKLHLGRFEWKSDPGAVEPIPDNCRIAVLGDWGSGLYGAPVCSGSIESDGEFALLLHLGDIYYAGTETEVQERFLDLWPSVSGALTRCLNGNHEMYSSGRPYIDMVGGLGQQASFFALQNEHWLLVGLDTAYTDHELAGDQVRWLEERVAEAGDRRVVLFSHHQPYSLFGEPGSRLIRQLAPLLDAGKIFAWYWGHEHRCVLFDQHRGWKMYGRCVGHSGFPEFRHESLTTDLPDSPQFVRCASQGLLAPEGLLLDGPNRYIVGHETQYTPHGYATIELDGPHLLEQYHDADGTPLTSQTDLTE